MNIGEKLINIRTPNFKKIDISSNIEDSVNLELFDIDVVPSGNLGINYD